MIDRNQEIVGHVPRDLRAWRTVIAKFPEAYPEIVLLMVASKLEGQGCTWDDAQRGMRWVINKNGELIVSKRAWTARGPHTRGASAHK